jgi:5-methylcytosine-specific restriction endonuclease McrA
VRLSREDAELFPGTVREALITVSSAPPSEPPARTDRPTSPPVRERIEPLAPERYKVQFTASASLKDKLERLKALMRHEVPCDLATVIELAVTEKLERLETKRFAKTSSRKAAAPQASAQTGVSARSRHVPAAVRREVYARDEGRCAFVDSEGRRCGESLRLEFHHRHPFGMGGDHRASDVSLLCAAHNRYLAERDYGAAAIRGHTRVET